MPNETWQSDFTHYRLTRPDGRPGTDIEIITWLDDHSRYALHVTAHQPVTAKIVLNTFRQAADLHGYPASTLTDNGMVYTVRLAGHGRGGGKNAFEAELRRLDIVQKNSRPSRPTTCGKVERFQQTLKKWLRAQPGQPTTLSRAPAPPRRLRRRVQPPPATSLAPPPSNPGDQLHHAPESHPHRRPQHRHPRPDPPRHRVDRWQRHPAHRRTTTPHRRRPNLRPNPRHPARPRPPRPRRQRRHRRTTPRPHRRSQQGLPAQEPTRNEKQPNLHSQVRLSTMS